MDEGRVFKSRYGEACDSKSPCVTNSGPARIQSIIQAGRIYKDNLWQGLDSQLAANPSLSIQYHKNCVSKYTSKSNLATILRRASTSTENTTETVPAAKRLCCSSAPFDFLQHCLYCADICNVTKDEKHPERWRPACMCRSTHSDQRDKPYKLYLIEKCDTRGDKWGEDVKHRVQGAISDLHAVEARYHRDCVSRFFANRSLVRENNDTSTKDDGTCPDLALDIIINVLCDDKNRIWNSIELHQEYLNHRGTVLSRAHLVVAVHRHFSGDLLVLSSPGFASIITFRANTAVILKLVKDDDEDDVPTCIGKVGKQTAKECAAIVWDKSSYNTHIDVNTAAESVSSTLLTLLTAISPKLTTSLPAMLIGSIITSMVTNGPTDLQVALGVLMRDSKQLIAHMYDYRVTCSNDEVLRFKKSAAVATARDLSQQGIIDAKEGLVQVICDNFDTDISSPNGKSSTHSLAMIITQPTTSDETDVQDTIRRLKKKI
uniref:uncharacterized protein isoform X1 n=1 Tax=Myxine glutinosa TaxID=7769 RepID=UPI00358F791D